MARVKRTPGPWVTDGVGVWAYPPGHPPDGIPICRVETSMEDASLIEAAPAMLAQLEKLIPTLTKLGRLELAVECQKVIDKANGEDDEEEPA